MSDSPVVLVPLAEEGTFRPLPKFFRRDKYSFTQLVREKDVAIFKQEHPALSCCWYEVVIIRGKQAYTIGGNYVEAAEYYPGSESWGTVGWTFNNYSRALEKYNQLLCSKK